MDPATYEYQSEIVKGYIAQGEAALIIKQLALRFGPLSDAVQARIKKASINELDAIGERLLTAKTLEDALDA